jgi:hypothetical protein
LSDSPVLEFLSHWSKHFRNLEIKLGGVKGHLLKVKAKDSIDKNYWQTRLLASAVLVGVEAGGFGGPPKIELPE